eukprot:1156700-Pelagomonas_calceolata.AAC.10
MCTEPLSEFVWRVTLMQDGLANSTCAAKERIEKKCNAFQKRPQVVKVLWQGSMLQFHFRATKTLKRENSRREYFEAPPLYHQAEGAVVSDCAQELAARAWVPSFLWVHYMRSFETFETQRQATCQTMCNCLSEAAEAHQR